MAPESFRIPEAAWPSCDWKLRYAPAEVSGLFPVARQTPEELERRCRVLEGLSVERRALAWRLEVAHRRWGAPPASLANAQAVSSSGTFLVVTGQQPGLLMGPLYTLHKAATAVALARAWSASGVANFVPCFWVASDDHDLAEVNRFRAPGREGGIRGWKLPLSVESAPSHRVRPGPTAAAWTSEIFQTLLQRGAESWTDRFAPREEDTLTDWFARVLLALFGKAGLVVLEPAEILWPAAGRHFETLLLQWPALRPEILAIGEDYRRKGWPEPVTVGEAPPLFVVEGNKRRRLAAGETLEGRSASPDVLARVALQNAMLPTVAQIAGPHETAYLPWARPLTRALAGADPVVVPRASATWLDLGQADMLKRVGFSLERFLLGPPAYEEAVAARIAPEIRLQLEGTDEAFDSAFSRLEDLALTLDANLAEPFRKGRSRVGGEVERLKRKVVSASLAQVGLGFRAFEALVSWVLPDGGFQERGLSAMAVLARFGEQRVLESLAGLDPFDCRHLGMILERAP